MTLRQTLGLTLALGLAGCTPTNNDTPESEPHAAAQTTEASEAIEVAEGIVFQGPESPQTICDARARQAQEEVRELFSHFDFRTSSMDFEPLRAAHAEEAKCLQEHGIEVQTKEETEARSAGSFTIIL